jgi:tetrahydromethanopterin S-methyltransferase subunit D
MTVTPKPAGGVGMDPMSMGLALLLMIAIIGVAFIYFGMSMMFFALIAIIVGGALIGFGVHFVPVGGAPAAMGQAPGIATGVAMLAGGAGLAGLFGGAWAAAMDPSPGIVVVCAAGAVGGALMMAITCMFVNVIYVYAMGIPAASGKAKVDPLTGDTQTEFKSQGTEGHGLPFISFVGGIVGGFLGGLGGTLIYYVLLKWVYVAKLATVLGAAAGANVTPVAISLAGMFAIGLFLVNAVLAAYNITGTIEGPHDPKFARWPRAVVATAVASAVCGIVAIAIVAV